MKEMYAQLGISSEVYDFGHKIEESLKERFEKFDKTAEYNQMKVLLAMQKNKVSAECFGSSSGYGYDDIGRETLEKVYADTFHTEACLVRPQITCGTHALAIALFGNLRPGDELLGTCRKTLRYSGRGNRHPPVKRFSRRIWSKLPSGGTVRRRNL